MTYPVPYAPPARCPGCGAVYTLTLVSDPTTPIYACGSTPSRIVCVLPRMRPAPDAIVNVVPPSDADLDDLASVLSGVAFAWAPTPRVTSCLVADCDAVAIDGLCMAHWRDDRITAGLAELA